jgi:hypothetical protein
MLAWSTVGHNDSCVVGRPPLNRPSQAQAMRPANPGSGLTEGGEPWEGAAQSHEEVTCETFRFGCLR